MNQTETEQSYREAVQSLQNLNNELFYDELKNKLRNHLVAFEEGNKETIKIIQEMNRTWQRVDPLIRSTIENSSKKMEGQMELVMHNTEEQLKNSFSSYVQDFNLLISNFNKLQERFIKIQSEIKEAQLSHENIIKTELEKQHKDNIETREKSEHYYNELMNLLQQNIKAEEKNLEAIYIGHEEIKNNVSSIKAPLDEVLKESQVTTDKIKEHYNLLEQKIAENNENQNKSNSKIMKIVIALGIGEVVLLLSQWGTFFF